MLPAKFHMIMVTLNQGQGQQSFQLCKTSNADAIYEIPGLSAFLFVRKSCMKFLPYMVMVTLTPRSSKLCKTSYVDAIYEVSGLQTFLFMRRDCIKIFTIYGNGDFEPGSRSIIFTNYVKLQMLTLICSSGLQTFIFMKKVA